MNKDMFKWERILDMLIDKGYDPDTSERIDDKTILHIAIDNNNINQVKVLFNKFPELRYGTYNGMNPLHYAIFLRRTDIVKFLLDSGFDPNEYSLKPYYMRPLGFALISGYLPEILHYLIVDYNAELTELDDKHNTILHMVYMYEMYWVVEYFNIDESEYIDIFNDDDMTPFDYAVMYDLVNVVRRYVNKERVNYVNKKTGKTILFYIDNKEILEIILPFINNINVRDFNGHTALYYAMLYKYDDDVINLLTQHGAKI
jgi:ankyrin repeat protein